MAQNKKNILRFEEVGIKNENEIQLSAIYRQLKLKSLTENLLLLAGCVFFDILNLAKSPAPIFG